MQKRRTHVFEGMGVTHGIVIGPAYLVENSAILTEPVDLQDEEEVEEEIARFNWALEETEREILEVAEKVRTQLDAQQAAIFEAHITILKDPLLIDQTKKAIREEKKNASHILWRITQEIVGQLKALGDSYFSERSSDLYEISRRVIKFLNRSDNSGYDLPAGESFIIVADELGPAEIAQLSSLKYKGFCTNAGGTTSHSAILARALDIAAVIGVGNATLHIRTGEMIILDASAGIVISNPTKEQLEDYHEQAEVAKKARQLLDEIQSGPTSTRDGRPIRIEANIELPGELPGVLQNGAEGIGLYRTEYLFMGASSLPDEKAQMAAYKKVLDSVEGLPVVFRTLDIGGDKYAPNIPRQNELNPFLGLRANRLCLAYPDFFRSQLRPLFRVASGKEIRLLLPMISTTAEVDESRAMINEVVEELKQMSIQPPERIILGIMVEIPSVAIMAEEFAQKVDFFSIGTNDLVQYTLAVDRGNKHVSYLYNPANPAVLRLIQKVVEAGRKHTIPVTVCGEMAGDPVMAALLVGLGVNCLSMSPALIRPVRRFLSGFDYEELTQLAVEAIGKSSPKEVQDLLREKLQQLRTQDSAAEVPKLS